ncbi:MAG: hydrogenase maturation nickel metallochaperone HypA [Nitrospirota bacterium]
MHEVSICESILDILKEEAVKNKASKVTSVTLKIGEMAGVVEDAMRFAFEAVAMGTIAQDATLVMEYVPLTARCRSCGKTFHIVGYAFSCKHCESPEIEVISGRELQIEDIDMEA